MKKPYFIFVYDTNKMPISYDVCWALTWADQLRRKKKFDFFQVIIVNLSTKFIHSCPVGHPDFISTDELRWRVRDIVVSAALIYRSVSIVTVCEQESSLLDDLLSQGVDVVFSPPIPKVYRDVLVCRYPLSGFMAGESERIAMDELIGHRSHSKLVSITIRDNGNGSKRDSQVEQWNEFADKIEKEGYSPVFIPDTSKWYECNKFYSTSIPQASLNLNLRMALYEISFVNLFVSSGPAALCYLTPCIPYMCFKILVKNERLASEDVLRDLGFEIGRQPIFVSNNQKWVWEDDEYKNIYREFSNFTRGLI